MTLRITDDLNQQLVRSLKTFVSKVGSQNFDESEVACILCMMRLNFHVLQPFGDCSSESCFFTYGAKFVHLESSSERASSFPRLLLSLAGFEPRNQLLADPTVS